MTPRTAIQATDLLDPAGYASIRIGDVSIPGDLG
jgi:hypothetical protein